MATYSIRDLENISGIKAHTLRIWEQRYEILQPKRTDTNIRYYEDSDLRLLLSISMLNSNGYKISAISKMDHETIHETCRSLQDVGDEFSNLINILILAMMDLDEARFEKMIASSTLKFGFEETMVKVIYPFFGRVGILWQTGTIQPIQEHFVSNLVRQKLIVAIDAQSLPKDPNVPTFALFLPEHEYHEIGLLYGSYILRSRQNRVYYLGQNVPEDNLDSIYSDIQPDYFLTILTVSPPKESSGTFLSRIGKKFPKSKILATGPETANLKAMPDNIILLKEATDLFRFTNRN